MKQNKLLITLIIFFTCTGVFAQTSETIDNAKLIELTKSQVGADLIISFMKSSKTNFNCSMTDILALKKENVSEKVLVEVMRLCDKAKATDDESNNINNPIYKHASGVYVYENGSTGSILKKLYATVIANEKGGGMKESLISRYSFGTAKSSAIVQINGESANVKSNGNSEFYFYFANEDQPNSANWWFSKATSPNEFTLIKLTQKRNVRQFKKGKSDAYSYQTGVDDDQKIQFNFEELKPGIFKVTPKISLKEGEYCFIYSASVPSQHSNDKVFDFSITK